jgi:hypothetical protein
MTKFVVENAPKTRPRSQPRNHANKSIVRLDSNANYELGTHSLTQVPDWQTASIQGDLASLA